MTDGTAPNVRKRAVPPIVCLFKGDSKYAAFLRQLKSHLSIAPVLTRRNKEELVIQTTTDDDYRAATTFLERSKIEFYVYRNLNDRTIKVVIRNLPESIESEEITEDLKEQGWQVIRSTQMRQRRTKNLLPMFIIELPDTAESKKIYDLKTVLCCRVKVEAYRGPEGPRQCHKCQRFNHVQACCNALPRCVKCGKDHKSSTCLKPYDDDPTCANCGQHHTANFGGCLVYQRAANSAASRTTGLRNPRATSTLAPRYVPAPIPTQNMWAPLEQEEVDPRDEAAATTSAPKQPA